MSAFIVEDDHIDFLVSYATGGGPYRASSESPQKLGQMLVDQNWRSVNFRYRENDPAPTYRYVPFTAPIRPVDVIKACDCYDYQACETEDYEETAAARLIKAIRSKAIRAALPALESAKWGSPPNPGRKGRVVAIA